MCRADHHSLSGIPRIEEPYRACTPCSPTTTTATIARHPALIKCESCLSLLLLVVVLLLVWWLVVLQELPEAIVIHLVLIQQGRGRCPPPLSPLLHVLFIPQEVLNVGCLPHSLPYSSPG